MGSGGVCHYCMAWVCMCDSPEGLVSSPAVSVDVEETSGAAVVETVEPRRVAVKLTAGIDSRFDAKTLSDISFAVVFPEDDRERYVAETPHVKDLQVVCWKIYRHARPKNNFVFPL
jgi:hypothetical protein